MLQQDAEGATLTTATPVVWSRVRLMNADRRLLAWNSYRTSKRCPNHSIILVESVIPFAPSFLAFRNEGRYAKPAAGPKLSRQGVDLSFSFGDKAKRAQDKA